MQRILAILALLAFLAAPAQAITLSRVTTFEAGTPIEADDMNAELDQIVDAINGNLGLDNLVAGAIATANIATAAVTTDKINNSAVTTAKIADSNVTRAKLGVLGEQISSSTSNVERSSPVELAIPNLTGNLTASGVRPVWVGLMAASSTTGPLPGRISYRHTGGGATDNAAYINFRKDFATYNMAAVGGRLPDTGTADVFVSYPCSTFWFLDPAPTAGPHNYTAYYRIATDDSGIIAVENCKLVVFEL